MTKPGDVGQHFVSGFGPEVRLEDALETEPIFSTLMGEEVEVCRKFIEVNALDVKNLDV